MRVFTSILLFACLVIAGAAGARLYFDQMSEKEAAVAPADAPTQAGPVDPKRLVHVVPPLAPPVPLDSSSSTPPNVNEPQPTLRADDGAVFGNEEAPPGMVVAPTEPRFIDVADLEAPAEVLERRITNKAKAILEQIAVVPVLATTSTTENDQTDEGRNNRDR